MHERAVIRSSTTKKTQAESWSQSIDVFLTAAVGAFGALLLNWARKRRGQSVETSIQDEELNPYLVVTLLGSESTSRGDRYWN